MQHKSMEVITLDYVHSFEEGGGRDMMLTVLANFRRILIDATPAWLRQANHQERLPSSSRNLA